jgi:hypothetical protein
MDVMRHRIAIASFAILACAAAISALAQAPATNPAPSDTLTARRQFRIEWQIAPPQPYGGDPQIPFSHDLLRSAASEVVNESAAQVLGWRLGPQGAAVSFSSTTPGASAGGPLESPPTAYWEGQVVVDLRSVQPPAPKRARELADAIVESLRQRLPKLVKQQAERIHTQEKTVAELQANEKMLQDELQSLRKSQKERGLEGVKPADLLKKKDELDQQKRAIEMDVLGMKARMRALEKGIDRESKRVQGAVASDEITAELQKVVDYRAQLLDDRRKMAAKGVYSDTDIAAAVAALAEARARLLERREAVADRMGGSILAAWNRELLNLGIDAEEKDAKLRIIQDYLDRVSQEYALLNRIDECRTSWPQAKTDSRSAEGDLAAMKSASLPDVPKLIVTSEQNQ